MAYDETTEQDEQQQPQGDIAVGDVRVSAEEAQKQHIHDWTEKIKAARARYKADFDRMRENMEFAFGIQWSGQKDLKDDRYIANITNRAVNQKVALLYAKDPKAVFRRRKRMLYQIWDGKLESLAAAVQRVTALRMHGGPQDIESEAIINDYEQGKMINALIDRVGETLEKAYQYQVDTQEPGFKTQMKQLVRRVVICGVGYVGISFEREQEVALDLTTTRSTIIERMKALKALTEEFLENSGANVADAEQIRMLAESVTSSMQRPGPDREGLTERVVFDFIPATSIIPDQNCRNLKGFVGARWVVHEMVLPVDFVNAFFECDIEEGGNDEGVKWYNQNLKEGNDGIDAGEKIEPETKRVCLWHVYDLDTKSHFYIVDGYCYYVQAPEPLEPQIRGFFPIFALTFNDCEVEAGQRATPFPPSDVDLMKSPQREWNRTRDGLREHRKSRAPKWLVPKGVISDDDLDAIASARPCQAIELESITKADDMNKVLMPFPHEPLDPAVYDTRVLADDMMFAQGSQEANLGPAKANVTATVGSIAEQSRMTASASNVDDLDDFLSSLARAGGEMLLREMSKSTVVRIVGPGAAWPEANRDDFLNSIYLEVVAASSGRPNKAMELQNARELGPLLLQAGANPMFLVREFIKRLDDRLDPEEAFPLVPPSPAPMPTPMSAMPGGPMPMAQTGEGM